MITFDHVSVQFAGSATPALDNINLEVPEGELVLVVGPTGSGKSTLLRCINGLVPQFSGGTLTCACASDPLARTQKSASTRSTTTTVNALQRGEVAAASGAGEKSTTGGLLIAASFSTAKLALTL